MPVGPLCVADEVSIDLMYHVLGQTKKDLGAGAVNAEMDRLVELFVLKLRRLGRKSGAGFYEYPQDGKKFLWPKLAEHFPPRPERNDIEEVKTRLLYRQSLETIRCLEEGILRHPRDADVGSVLGWGFPAYAGGALSFAEFVGLPQFLAETERLHGKYGERFAVPKLLRAQAEKRVSFYEGRK